MTTRLDRTAALGPVRAAQQRWLSTAERLLAADMPEAAAMRLATRQGFVLTRAQARDCGVPERDARRLVRRRAWTTPRHGVLAPLPPTGDGTSAGGPELAATAAALVWTDTAISYASAAALHCLPLLRPAGPPAMTADREHRACSRTDVRLHIAALPPDEVTTWFGAPVTSVERTVVDLARARGVSAGVVAADAALREGLTTQQALLVTAARQCGWPGVRAARAAVALADGRAESPLESLTRLCLLAGGLPKPELQFWIDTAGGRFRVDMIYLRERLIIECDGLLKYRDDPKARGSGEATGGVPRPRGLPGDPGVVDGRHAAPAADLRAGEGRARQVTAPASVPSLPAVPARLRSEFARNGARNW